MGFVYPAFLFSLLMTSILIVLDFIDYFVSAIILFVILY